MGKEKEFKVVIARPAKERYQLNVLPYIFNNFSLKRAQEVDENILQTIQSLSLKPSRGRREKYLVEEKEEFRFILHKETAHFELKVIYYIDFEKEMVFITDLFPTKMNTDKIAIHHKK